MINVIEEPLYEQNHPLEKCSQCSEGVIRYHYQKNDEDFKHWVSCDWWLCAINFKLPVNYEELDAVTLTVKEVSDS